MRRWRTLVTGLVVCCAAAAGCDRQCLVREADADHYREGLHLAASLDDAAAPLGPPVSPRLPEPATVVCPERLPYHLTLREAIALALERGTVGVQSNRLPGVANDDLVQFTGQGLTAIDSIRVLAIEPALFGAAIEGALARFDPLLTSSINWTTTDEPSEGLNFLQNGQAATFSTSLAKPLPTGGVAGITFSNNYNFFTSPLALAFTPINPAYLSRLQFGVEQPLLRDYGVETNQLLATPSISTLFPGLNFRRPGYPPEGILISRVRFDQSRAEFARNVNFLLLNVETAYWNLYGSYVVLYSAEQALRQAHATWLVSVRRFRAHAIDEGDLAQTRAQYEQFRGDRLQALQQVLEGERTLRLLLGLPASDGKQLVPIDAPTVAPYQPNWEAALEDALFRRPELTLARDEIKAKQLNLQQQQNYLKPDLRFAGTYSLVGVGSRLDGSGTVFDPLSGQTFSENALRTLASGRYTDWTAGLTLNVPLGFRLEHTLLRQARLQLLQAHLVLKDQEARAQVFLARQYSQVLEAYQRIQARQAQRQAYAIQVATRSRKFTEGNVTIDFLLESQRQWASALSSEAQAVVDYNNALARFEFARGTIQEHDSIQISEGPLPECVQVRAVEHERERTQALLLRERALPPGSAARPVAVGASVPPAQSPCQAEQTAPSLMSLFGTETPGQAPAAPIPATLPALIPPAPAGPEARPGPATHLQLGFEEGQGPDPAVLLWRSVVAVPLVPVEVPCLGESGGHLGQPAGLEPGPGTDDPGIAPGSVRLGQPGAVARGPDRTPGGR